MVRDRADKTLALIFFCCSPFKSSEEEPAIKIPVKIVHICNIGSSIFRRYIGTQEYLTACNIQLIATNSQHRHSKYNQDKILCSPFSQNMARLDKLIFKVPLCPVSD